MKKLLLATALAGVLAAPAQAQVLLGGELWSNTGTTLTLTEAVPTGNQPLNVQCVICGDHQPQQDATFGYTNFQNTGNADSLIYFSTNVSGGGNAGFDTVGTAYDGTFLRNYLLANGDGSLNFSIGIDVNDSGVNGVQTLEAFALLNLTQHTVLAQYSLLQPGGALIPSQNNGTGFPDYTLSGFNIQLGSDIQLGDQLIFYARISGATDGPDSFFIQPQAVPGPIVGAGIPGLIMACGVMLALARNRKRKSELGVA